MKVLLDAIWFCHSPSSGTRGALAIRWDATRDVTPPEWRRGACVGPEDSPVAYAISETEGHPITIKARFRRMAPGIETVEIRAIDATFQNCEWLAKALGSVGLDRLPSSNPLGEVSPRCVTFSPDGLSDFSTFELAGNRFEELGVGAWTTSWQWQYRQADGEWVDFDRSEHRTFLLLETPKEPWTQQVPPPLGLSLPRVDALEYACRWSQGSHTRSEVAAGVTRGIYRAGPDLLRYDRPGLGGSHYIAKLTLLLERLRGGEGNGAYVNCQDCGDVVTTLANLLGCELWSCPIFGEDWETNPQSVIPINPIIVIGDADWGFPFPDQGEWFKMHQAAFDGEATLDDRVFDACLMVDGDEEPTKVCPDRTPLLPVDIPFAQAKGLTYRERFAAPAGQGCYPDEFWRIRWPISESNTTRPAPSVPPAIQRFARLEEWSGARSAGADILFFPFDMTGSEIPGWHVIRADRTIEGDVPYLHFLMAPTDGRDDSRLRVETWQLPGRNRAHEHLAELLGRLEGGPPPRLDPLPVGDVAFAVPNRFFLAFARGNLVVWIRNVGLNLRPVEDAAAALDRWLTFRPDVPFDARPATSPERVVATAPSARIGYKYFADQGELSIKHGTPILEGVAPGGASVVRVSLESSSQRVAETLNLAAE